MGLHDLEHACAVFFVGFVAGGEQAGGGGSGDLFEVVRGFPGEVYEVLVDDSGDSMDGAVDGGDLSEFTGFESDADDALIDNGSGAAALGDEDFSFETVTHVGGTVQRSHGWIKKFQTTRFETTRVLGQ